jgi:hypothetical protein
MPNEIQAALCASHSKESDCEEFKDKSQRQTLVYTRRRDGKTNEKWADCLVHHLRRPLHVEEVIPAGIYGTEL